MRVKPSPFPLPLPPPHFIGDVTSLFWGKGWGEALRAALHILFLYLKREHSQFLCNSLGFQISHLQHDLQHCIIPNNDVYAAQVEVFEHSLEQTNGDDLAKLLLLKSPSSEVQTRHDVPRHLL